MTELKPQTVVRVRQLIHPIECYDARQGMNKRPPQVGDIGRVLQFLHIPVRPDADAYAVESISSQDGASIWFAAFSPEELEPLDGVPSESRQPTPVERQACNPESQARRGCARWD
jgi:hypothetical protein